MFMEWLHSDGKIHLHNKGCLMYGTKDIISQE